MYAFDTHTIHCILYIHRMRETVEDRDQGPPNFSPPTSVPAVPPPTLSTPRVLRGLPTVADGYLSGSQTERKHRDRVSTESVSSACSSAAGEGLGGGVRGTGGMTWFQESPGTSHGRRPRDAYEYSPLSDAGAEIKRGADNEEEEEDVEGMEKNVSHKTCNFLGAVVGRVVHSPVTVVPSMLSPPPAVGLALNRPSSSLSTLPTPTGISIRYPSTPLHLSPQLPQGSGGGVDAGDKTVTEGVQKASPVYPSPPPLRDAAMAVRERERARGREREVQREKGREASQTKPDEQRRSPSFQPFTSSWDKGQHLFEAGKEAEGVRASADGGWRVCADGAEDVFARAGACANGNSLLGSYGIGRGQRTISPLSTSLRIASPSSTTTLRIASPSHEVMAPTPSENRLIQPSSMSPPSRLLSSLQQTGHMHPPPHHKANASSMLAGSAAQEPRNVFGDAVGEEGGGEGEPVAISPPRPSSEADNERAPYNDAQLDDAGSAEDGGARTGVETQVLSQDTPCGVPAAAVQARLSPSPSLHPSSHVALEQMQAQKTSLQGAVREADAILSTPSPKAGSAAGERERGRQREVKPASTRTAQVQVARQVTNDREFEFVTSVHAAMSSLFLEVYTF